MAADTDARSSLRKTVASYVRRLVRVGLAAQTLSSSGASALAINRLVGSAVLIASQLQRAIVVRVVGAPLIRRRPRRGPGESADEYPEPSAISSTALSPQEEQGTEWQEVAPTTLALAETETQPFTIARMLPSMVLAQQTALRPLASMRSAVAGAVGNLGLSPVVRTGPSQTNLGTPGMGSREVALLGLASSTAQAGAWNSPGEARESPSSTSFGTDASRESTAGGSTGAGGISAVPSRVSPSKTSVEPVARAGADSSFAAPQVTSPQRTGAGQKTGASEPSSTSFGLASTSDGHESTTQFSPNEQRESPSGTSVEGLSSGGSPYSAESAAPTSTAAPVSALGVVAAFQAAASSMVFNLNNAAQETTRTTLGPQALGTSFSVPGSRSGLGTTAFQLPLASPSSGTPSLKAGLSPSTPALPGSAPGSGTTVPQAPSAPVSTSDVSSSLPVTRADPSASTLAAQVKAGSGSGSLAGTLGAPESPLASASAEAFAVPRGLGSAFSTQAVGQATQLSLQVGTLASPAGSAPLPLRAGSGGGTGTSAFPLSGPETGAALYPSGAAYSVSSIVASLGLGNAESYSSNSISNDQAFGPASLAAGVAPPGARSEYILAPGLPPQVTGAEQNPLALSEEGEGEAILSASEGATSETRAVGPLPGVSSGQKRPDLVRDNALFGNRWLASVAAATSVGGSLLDALAFPAQSAFPGGAVALTAGRSPSGFPAGVIASSAQATHWPSEAQPQGTTVSAISQGPSGQTRDGFDVPTHEGAPSLGPGADVRTEAPMPNLQAALSISSAPPNRAASANASRTPSSRSVWEAATILPGLLTPALALAMRQERQGTGAFFSPPTGVSARVGAPSTQPLGLSPLNQFNALAAADFVRRTVLRASAGPLGARLVEGLAPGTTFIPAGSVGADARSSSPSSAAAAEFIASTLSAERSESLAPGAVSAPSGTLARRGRASPDASAGAREPFASPRAEASREAAALEGFGPPSDLDLESISFPSVQAALGSAAGLRTPPAVLRGDSTFPAGLKTSERGGEGSIRQSVRQTPAGSPGLPIGTSADGLVEGTSLSPAETGPAYFFGLETVARALSIASRLPSTQLGGVFTLPPRRAALASTPAPQRSQPARGTPVQVQFAAENPPEVSEPWRAAPEEAISDALSEVSERRSYTSGQPAEEPDDRELRKKIERMIDEELRRYGYQP